LKKQKAKNKLLAAESAVVESPQNPTPLTLPSSEALTSTPTEDSRFFDFCQLYASAGDKPRRSRSFSSLPRLEENQRINHEPPTTTQAPHSASVAPHSVPLQPRRLSQTPHLQQAAQQSLQNSPPQPVTRPIARETVTYVSNQSHAAAHRRRTSEPAFCTADIPNTQSHMRTSPAPTAPTAQTSQLPPPRFSPAAGPVLSPSRNPPPMSLQSPQSRGSRPTAVTSRYPPPSISTQSPRFVPKQTHANSPHPTHSPHGSAHSQLPPQHTSPSQLRHDMVAAASSRPAYDPSIQYDTRVGQQFAVARPRGDSVEIKLNSQR